MAVTKYKHLNMAHEMWEIYTVPKSVDYELFSLVRPSFIPCNTYNCFDSQTLTSCVLLTSNSLMPLLFWNSYTQVHFVSNIFVFVYVLNIFSYLLQYLKILFPPLREHTTHPVEDKSVNGV
jgi:hypothetical protein